MRMTTVSKAILALLLSLTSIDQVSVLRLESLTSLVLGAAGLGNNELDIILLNLDITSGCWLFRWLVLALERWCPVTCE